MSQVAYKVLHLTGVFLLFLSVGAVLARSRAGAAKDRLAGISHGVALLVILIAGFGLLARGGIGFPLWVWAKLGIWIVMAGVVVAIRRSPQVANLLWWALPLLGGAAAWLALARPGG